MDKCRSEDVSFAAIVRLLLSSEEEEQINQQSEHKCRRDRQVLWSGIPREFAQARADHRNVQTLTTAMGPLMDTDHAHSVRSKKPSHGLSLYMKGASALFARYVTRSAKVTVLSPPPQRFHPSGATNYQLVEGPILKGAIGSCSVGRIEMVHPTVEGAENFSYQY